MATIEPYTTSTGQKRYRVRYRTPEHKQTDKRGFRTKRDAELFRASIEVGINRGEYIAPRASKVTIGTLGEEWLERQTHLKPSSLRPIHSAWAVHVRPRWGAVALEGIRTTAVQSWVAELGKVRSATTVARAYGVLAAILDDAVADRRVLANPARGIKLPRRRPRSRVYLTHEQVHTLAREAKRYETLILVLAYCGLRWGEATGLRVRDVDLVRRRLTIELNAVEVGQRIVVGTPKTHARRSVPFPEFLRPGIAAACSGKPPDDLVFPGPDGTHLKRTRSDVKSRGWFAGAVRRSDVPRITPHDLRHTAASLAVSAGANVKAVQRMLGHASAAMTLDTYADLFDDDLDAVSDALHREVPATSVGKT